MSRLWRERILAWMAPDALAWVRLHRGLTPAAYQKRVLTVDPSFGHEPWHGVVETLRAQAETWRNDAVDVNVVLSNHFVRYTLVPHAASAGSDEERLALARFHFSKIHGDDAQAWDLRLSATSGKAPRVASAVDTALIAAIKACFPAKAAVRLVSVQPWLMSAFNTARSQLPGDGAWLLLIEHERTCVALISGGALAAVRNVKGHFENPQTWRDLVEREQLRIELADPPTRMLVQSARNLVVPSHTLGAWTATSLPLRTPPGIDALRDGAYQPALSAL